MSGIELGDGQLDGALCYAEPRVARSCESGVYVYGQVAGVID